MIFFILESSQFIQKGSKSHGIAMIFTAIQGLHFDRTVVLVCWAGDPTMTQHQMRE